MKNLKDEIEYLAMNIVHQIGDALDDELKSGKMVLARQNTNDKCIDFVKGLVTSLIEQEKERAVREFVNLCHKNEIYGDTGVVIGNFIGSNKSDLECLAEQYLAERKGE